MIINIMFINCKCVHLYEVDYTPKQHKHWRRYCIILLMTSRTEKFVVSLEMFGILPYNRL